MSQKLIKRSGRFYPVTDVQKSGIVYIVKYEHSRGTSSVALTEDAYTKYVQSGQGTTPQLKRSSEHVLHQDFERAIDYQVSDRLFYWLLKRTDAKNTSVLKAAFLSSVMYELPDALLIEYHRTVRAMFHKGTIPSLMVKPEILDVKQQDIVVFEYKGKRYIGWVKTVYKDDIVVVTQGHRGTIGMSVPKNKIVAVRPMYLHKEGSVVQYVTDVRSRWGVHRIQKRTGYYEVQLENGEKVGGWQMLPVDVAQSIYKQYLTKEVIECYPVVNG